MRSIDIHAHLVPESMRRALARGETWHGIGGDEDRRRMILFPAMTWNVEQRLADMDSLGVDVQVISTFVGYTGFQADDAAVAACRETNDEVAQMTREYPNRFSGFATIPIQNLKAAVTELERGVTQLGLKGTMISDVIDGRTLDQPELLPFWKAAEEMGAIIFVHQGGATLVSQRTERYHLPNSIGNLVDRAVTFASLVFSGVMDACPDLKVCLAHGGGYTCFGIGRMDRGWQVRPEAQANIQQPPSAYLSRFYYDCLTHGEAALRMLIDTVGIDRVVFGTDWPADMAIDWPVSWILSLESLTQEEKEAILHKNLENLLGI